MERAQSSYEQENHCPESGHELDLPALSMPNVDESANPEVVSDWVNETPSTGYKRHELYGQTFVLSPAPLAGDPVVIGNLIRRKLAERRARHSGATQYDSDAHSILNGSDPSS